MSFEVGQSYERQTDRASAAVARIFDEIAVLQLKTGEEISITAADVPSKWRLYENCPECAGLGQLLRFQTAVGVHPTTKTQPTCPTCKGLGRTYPR
jgi:DnaJ-class molecular chaperone